MFHSDDTSRRSGQLSGLLEDELARVLSVAGSPTDDGSADAGVVRLVESMRYSLGTPGKRIRPMLLLSTAEALGMDPSGVLGFAVGLEMIHAYSLIHDDLPAMDDDDLRRGYPTNHRVYGAGMATLAGDGLLTEAFVAMLRPCVDPALQLRVVSEVAVAAGMLGMVGGQASDLLAEGVEPDAELLRSIHRRKTGTLLQVSVRAAALLAEASERELRGLDEFGLHFGLAFQIADDLKDELLPSELTGKTPGGDRLRFKLTYPAVFGVESSKSMCREELEVSLSALTVLGERAALLELLARDAISPVLSGADGTARC